MRVEPIENCSSYFDHKKDNPYNRIPFKKTFKSNGKTFLEVLKECQENSDAHIVTL